MCSDQSDSDSGWEGECKICTGVQMEEDLSSCEQTGPDINLQWQLWDKQANNGTSTALAIGQQVYPNKHWHLYSV